MPEKQIENEKQMTGTFCHKCDTLLLYHPAAEQWVCLRCNQESYDCNPYVNQTPSNNGQLDLWEFKDDS